MFTSSATGSCLPLSSFVSTIVLLPSVSAPYTCVQPGVESTFLLLSSYTIFIPSLSHSFASFPRPSRIRSAAILRSSSIRLCRLFSRGIQMTSDDEYAHLSRPVGNCRYFYPYFCPRCVHLRRCTDVHTPGTASTVGSFLPSLRIPLLTFLPRTRSHNTYLGTRSSYLREFRKGR